MDQKNTIVKCNATTCLYNHKGICDQYVIDLDMYGQCKDYCECEKTEAPAQLKSDLEYDEKSSRGKRAELPMYDDYADWLDKRCRASCKHFSDRAGYPYCDFTEQYLTQLGRKCEAYEEV